MGSRGPQAVTGMIQRRFGSSRWDAPELGLVSDYVYHITAAPASGQHVLNILLQTIFVDPSHRNDPNGNQLRTGVYAKLPLEHDLCALKVPILLLFGDDDWMAHPTAARSVERWNLARKSDTDKTALPNNGDVEEKKEAPAKLLVVPGAGHHLYLDNPDFFSRAIGDWASSWTN